MTHHKLVAMEQPVYVVATENDRIAQDERDLGSQANQEHSERLHCDVLRDQQSYSHPDPWRHLLGWTM